MAEYLKLVGGGGGQFTPNPPGGGDEMDTRLTKLETKIETVLPTLSTKGDVSEAKASIVMWLAGVIAASTAIVIAVFLFALNRTMPVQQPTQLAPIIIYPQQMPSQQQTNPPSSQSLTNPKGDR